jgi:DNA-directed RNA polymerase specialized sigma24 family protein
MEEAISSKASVEQVYLFARSYIGKICKSRFNHLAEEIVHSWIVRVLENGYLEKFDSEKSDMKTWVINGLRSEFSNRLKYEAVRRHFAVDGTDEDIVPNEGSRYEGVMSDDCLESSFSNSQEEAREQLDNILDLIEDKVFGNHFFVCENEKGEEETFKLSYTSVLRLLAMGYSIPELAGYFGVAVQYVRQVFDAASEQSQRKKDLIFA